MATVTPTVFLAAILVIALVVLMLYDVVLRYAFNAPTSWGNDLNAFLMGGSFVLSIAYAMSTAIAVSSGRSAIHCSSPSTARVAHARSCAGLPNTTGLTAIHTPTSAASRPLRRHTGTSISGALAHLVHALHGLLCRANTARLTFRQSSIDASFRPASWSYITPGPPSACFLVRAERRSRDGGRSALWCGTTGP